MFNVDYVYIPLSGQPYCANEKAIAVEFQVVDDRVNIVLTHRAHDLTGKVVTFQSHIIVPPQRISVETVAA